MQRTLPLLASSAVAVLLAVPAQAGEDPPPLLTVFGKKIDSIFPPHEPQEFWNTMDVARDSVGNYYVTDRDLGRVQKFNSAGTYLGQWGGMDGPLGIAVGAGDQVFVQDGAATVRVFDTSGSLLDTWPITLAVFPTAGIGAGGGFVYVCDITGLKQFLPDGTLVDEWPMLPYDADVAPNGDVFVTAALNACDVGVVKRLSPDGILQAEWGQQGAVACPGGGPGWFLAPYNVAVDNAGSVYVSDQFERKVEKFSGDGDFLWRLDLDPSGPTRTPIGTPAGLTVGDDGVLSVVDRDPIFLGAVSLFGDAPLTLAADIDQLGPGDDLTLRFFGGEAAQPMALFLTAVNGAPSVQLLLLDFLDANGAWTATAPAPLQPGDDFTLLAFSIEGGFALPSNQITIEIQ